MPSTAPRVVHTVDRFEQTASVSDRDHHHARCPLHSLEVDDLAARAHDAGSPPQARCRRRTAASREHRPPIDRAATSRTNGRPSGEPNFGVDRPLDETDGAARVGDCVADRCSRLCGQARRSDVDRLLEVRALERIRLVEDREDLERALPQQPLDGNLGPRDVTLDEDGSASSPPSGAMIAATRMAADASSSMLFARMTPRLPDRPMAFTTHG